MSRFHLTRGKLHVLSGICVNLLSAWLVTLFVIKDLPTLTGTILAVIVSLLLAIKAEELVDTL